MIWLWRYLFGYLTIVLCGENAERVLNTAAKCGINIWDLRCKKGNITGNISVKNFVKLKNAKRGIKCRVKILQKRGLVFKTHKYINRTGFFIGIALFFSILFTLSNFVWVINVVGNTKIPTDEILDSCKKIGIYEGVYKKKINTKYDSQRLLLIQKGLAWGAVNIEGCVLTVNLSEAEISDKDKRQNPSNLKASFDGKINKIDVTSGDVKVKVGDIVSRGEILVSGIVENFSSTLFVHSEGVITAQTEHTFSSSGEFLQEKNISTNKIKNRYSFELFKLKIPLFFGTVKGEYDYKCDVKNLTLFGNKIPIKTAKETYILTRRETVNYENSTLEQILYEDIINQVKKHNFISFEEMNRETVLTDNSMLLKITYNCEENIALQDEILLNKEN